MCDMRNDCEYEGELETAYSQKDVEFSTYDDKEFIYDGRIQVEVCPNCGEPDWRTMC